MMIISGIPESMGNAFIFAVTFGFDKISEQRTLDYDNLESLGAQY